MDKSDMFLSAGSMMITAALIMWETFGLMVTPTVLTAVAGVCFVAAGLCSAEEERRRESECKRKRR